MHFGKWIFVSSMVFFLSTYIDRLYLGKVVPLELLGIYGIARSISDLTGNLVLRLGFRPGAWIRRQFQRELCKLIGRSKA
jgi:hypothetical protein